MTEPTREPRKRLTSGFFQTTRLHPKPMPETTGPSPSSCNGRFLPVTAKNRQKRVKIEVFTCFSLFLPRYAFHATCLRLKLRHTRYFRHVDQIGTCNGYHKPAVTPVFSKNRYKFTEFSPVPEPTREPSKRLTSGFFQTTRLHP